MNERDLRRVADLLGNFGIAGSVLEGVLMLRVPVTETQTFPVLLTLEELGPDLYRAELHQSARVPVPKDPEIALALFTFANVANTNMDVARCAVLPDDPEDGEAEDGEAEDEAEEELEDAEAEDGNAPAAEEEESGEEAAGGEDDDAPGFNFVRCDVSSAAYLGGLKQNHLKLLARHIEAFTDDVTECFARFLETAGLTPPGAGDEDGEDAQEVG